MQQYVVELSKYIILGCIILYTVTTYLALVTKGKVAGVLFVLQNLLTFAFTFLCFVDLTFVTGDVQYLYLFAFLELFILLTVMLVTFIYEKCNRLLLNNMCLLISTGITILARLSFSKAIKQYIILLISLAICLAIPYLMYRIRFFKKFMWFYAFLGVFLLGGVLALGELTYGANISYSVAGITFQPSEFVKIIYLFFLAAFLWNKNSILWVALSAIIAGVHVIVLVFSNDLGSALIFFVAYVLIVFIATANYFYLLCGVFGGVLASIISYRLFSHVRVRVLAWQDPFAYIDTKGYQITQSLFAVTSGSWFGMGLMQGTPGDIPFVETDFIFSAICEEFGVLFAICLLLIFISCFIEMIHMAFRIGDRFYQILVFGTGVMFLFQTFLTVGGGIKYIPLTGVTLPFISYGGSSMMTSMMMFFIVQGINIKLLTVLEKQEIERTKGSNEKK